MSSHPDIEQLSAYLDGELSADERRDVAAHVAGCPGCAAELEGLQWVVSFSRAMPDHPLPADLRLDEAELVSRPQHGDQGHEIGESGARGGWFGGPSRWSLGTAAALLMAGFLILIGGEATRQAGGFLDTGAASTQDGLMSEEEVASDQVAKEPALNARAQSRSAADTTALDVDADQDTAADDPEAENFADEDSAAEGDGRAPAAAQSAADAPGGDVARRATTEVLAQALIATATAMAAEPEAPGRLNPATMTAVAAEFMPTSPPDAPDTGRAEATPTPEAVEEAMPEPTSVAAEPEVVAPGEVPPEPQGIPLYRLLGWTLIGLAVVVAGLGFLRP